MSEETEKNVSVPLFLDVDGVLNVFPHNRHNGQWGDYTTELVETFGRKFPLTISRKCCDALADLPADIQWLTTWCDEANEKLSHITGFAEYPVFAHMPFRERGNWKYSAVSNWYNSPEGRKRFVWIDDDAIPHAAEKDFPKALIIRTDPTSGITPQHVERIRDYVESAHAD